MTPRRMPTTAHRITHPPITFTGRSWGGERGRWWLAHLRQMLSSGCLDAYRRDEGGGKWRLSVEAILRMAEQDVRWAGPDGANLYVHVRVIAKRSGYSVRHVRYYRRFLERSGLAVCLLRGRPLTWPERLGLYHANGRKGSPQRGLTTVYALTLPESVLCLPRSRAVAQPSMDTLLILAERPAIDLTDRPSLPVRALRLAIAVARLRGLRLDSS